jgi:hypothetical protein
MTTHTPRRTIRMSDEDGTPVTPRRDSGAVTPWEDESCESDVSRRAEPQFLSCRRGRQLPGLGGVAGGPALPPPPRLSSPDRAQLGNGLAVISNHQKAFSLPDAGQRSVQVITDLLHIQRRHRQAMLTAWETAEPARWVQRAMDVSLKRLF